MFESVSTGPPPAWLERELRAGLVPVEAPRSLWEAVGLRARPSVRRAPRLLRLSPVLALLALAAGSGWYLTATRPASPLGELALAVHRDLAGHPEKLELRTESASAVEAWLGGVGLSATLAVADDARRACLIGARLIRYRKADVAALAYRVGDRPATLLLARAGDLGDAHPSAGPMRVFTRSVTADGLVLFTWRMHGQDYALVSDREGRQACVVCHV